MGKAPVRAVTDDEMLSGDDETNSLDRLDDEANERDEHEDGIIGAPPQDVDKGDDIEVVILDEDEGKDKAGKEAAADAESDPLVEDDDSGEEVDTDEPRADLTDWEKKNYSKAMQGRILRERNIRARKEAEAQQQVAAAANAVRAARAETLDAQKLSTALLVQVLERDISSKQTEVLAAKEAGEAEKELKLLGELGDLQAKKRDVEAAKERLDRAVPAEVKTVEVTKQSPDTQAWMARNRWFSNKQFGPEVIYTRSIDVDLAEAYKAGRFSHAPGTPKYFIELDRRIHEKMPALRAQIKKTYGEPRRGAPAAPVSRSAPSKPSNKVILTRAQLENMSNFGLDHKNPEHLKAYAKQVRDGASR